MTRALVERGLSVGNTFNLSFFEYIYFLKSVFEYLQHLLPLAIFSYIHIIWSLIVVSKIIINTLLCNLISKMVKFKLLFSWM